MNKIDIRCGTCKWFSDDYQRCVKGLCKEYVAAKHDEDASCLNWNPRKESLKTLELDQTAKQTTERPEKPCWDCGWYLRNGFAFNGECRNPQNLNDANKAKYPDMYYSCEGWIPRNIEIKRDRSVKQDANKPRLTLTPTKIIECVARVREWAINNKYHDPESWRQVEIERYRDATYRHWLAYINDPKGVDPETGLPHLWHFATDASFLCELEEFDDEN